MLNDLIRCQLLFHDAQVPELVRPILAYTLLLSLLHAIQQDHCLKLCFYYITNSLQWILTARCRTSVLVIDIRPRHQVEPRAIEKWMGRRCAVEQYRQVSLVDNRLLVRVYRPLATAVGNSGHWLLADLRTHAVSMRQHPMDAVLHLRREYWWNSCYLYRPISWSYMSSLYILHSPLKLACFTRTCLHVHACRQQIASLFHGGLYYRCYDTDLHAYFHVPFSVL